MTVDPAAISAKKIGRIVGFLFLAQMLLAIPVYTEVGWLHPIIAPGFLENAAGSALQIRIALLLVFVLGSLTLAIAIIALPLFRQYSTRMSVLFLALGIIGLAMQAMEGHASRTMLSLSIEYAKANAPKEILEAFAPIATATWRSTHFTNLTLGHVKVFVLYLILFRFALVPRPLAAVGVAATMLSTTAAAMPLLGQRFSYLLVMPTALVQLALIVLLLVRGFRERAHPQSPAPNAVGHTVV